MSDWIEFSARSVNEALTEAIINLKTTSDRVDYEIIQNEKSGILGLFSKPAKIRVKVKFDRKTSVLDFLTSVFEAMKIVTKVKIEYLEEEEVMNIDLTGEDMGILIGKRGQTLDSLQYLTSLVANRNSKNYIKVKLDTENYRARRKETLENLAKNIAHKVKKTKHPVTLEPMNPYERRIIHSALQGDKFVDTHSEGDEPFRKVVISVKKGYNDTYKKQPYTKQPYTKSKYAYNRKLTESLAKEAEAKKEVSVVSETKEP